MENEFAKSHVVFARLKKILELILTASTNLKKFRNCIPVICCEELTNKTKPAWKL